MLEPLPAAQWNEATAAHLLNRAGFGGSPQDVESLRQMGLNGAVSWLVNYDHAPDNTPPPDWAHPDPDLIARRNAIRSTADRDTRRQLESEYRSIENQQIAELRYWWLRRMAQGPRPFQEKMALFWHGHFATSFEKVRSPYFLWQQNELFRQNATTDFRQLLTLVSEDPAMLVYLDGASSHKGKPNENFAREVMELFTLGEGHYTEQDIQQAAKAYTGWGIAKDQLHYEYHRNNHDDGPKTVFGQTGNFTGEQMLNLICDQPQCATFITKKIWRFFVQDEPPQPVIDQLAAEFRAHNLDLKHLMATIFRSKEFYAPDVIRAQIKSPVQWLVASTHQLQSPLPAAPMALAMLLQLGEELFQPPNVKGWDGGIAWITTNSLLDRYNFAAAFVEGPKVQLQQLQRAMGGVVNTMRGPQDMDMGDASESERQLMQVAPADVKSLFTLAQLADTENFLAAMQARFLNGTLSPLRLTSLRDFLKTKSPIQEDDIRQSIRLLMSTPEYQLT